MREITVVVSSKGKARDAAALALPAPAAAFEGLLPQGDVLACGRDFLVRRGADGRVAGLFWDEDGDPWTAKVTYTALSGGASFVIRRWRLKDGALEELPEKTLRRYANSAGILEVKIPAENTALQ